MTLWTEPNQDAMTITPDQAATGPRVGFLDAFETSYNAQTKASAQFGIEKAMYEEDAKQVETLRKAGVEDLPHLSDAAVGFFGMTTFQGDYLETARFYQDGGSPGMANFLKQYDDKVETLRQKFPDLDLRTSRDMWETVRANAQKYDKQSETERHSWGGTFGSFAGGVVGGVNPSSDPLNALTLGVGGAGKSVVARVAAEAGAQGLIEGINQITGVQEERRLLGLSHGFGDGLSRVATAAAGGAVLQGAGEVLDVGLRRWFRNVAHDPAPAAPTPSSKPLADASHVPESVIPADPELQAGQLAREPLTYMRYLQETSPWSVSRAGKARTILDADNVRVQLDDWQGPGPAFTSPKADTASNVPRNDFTKAPSTIFDRVAETPRVDDIAREVDPDTFRMYDKFADEKAAYVARLTELEGDRNVKTTEALTDISNRIDVLSDKINTSGAMKSKKYATERAALIFERETMKTELLKTDTPDMARMRRKVMQNDEKMRDMAPVVSRAYARARNKWDNTAADREGIRKMIAEGRKSVGDTADVHDPLAALPQSIYDKAPILQQRAKVEAGLKQDADAADVAKAVLDSNAKAAEIVLETYRASVDATLKRLAEFEKADKQLPTQTFYHGGKAGLTEFTDHLTRDGKLKDKYDVYGIYATKSKTLAEQYVPKENGRLYQVELDYKNALTVPDARYPGLDSAALTKKEIDQLKKDGFDAVINDDKYKQEIIVFDKNQIRLAKEGGGALPDEITVPGYDKPMNLDKEKIIVPNENGEGERTISIRQLLDEQNAIEEDLKAVSSCSIR
jgi:hypothetical protein